MDETTSSPRPNLQPALPTCRCGFTRNDFWVSARAKYSTWGFIMGVFMGISGTLPKRIQFQCRKCGQIIEERTDRKSIEAFREH